MTIIKATTSSKCWGEWKLSVETANLCMNVASGGVDSTQDQKTQAHSALCAIKFIEVTMMEKASSKVTGRGRRVPASLV